MLNLGADKAEIPLRNRSLPSIPPLSTPLLPLPIREGREAECPLCPPEFGVRPSLVPPARSPYLTTASRFQRKINKIKAAEKRRGGQQGFVAPLPPDTAPQIRGGMKRGTPRTHIHPKCRYPPYHHHYLRQGFPPPHPIRAHRRHPHLTTRPIAHPQPHSLPVLPSSIRVSPGWAPWKFLSRPCRRGCAAGGSGLGRLLAATQSPASGAMKPPLPRPPPLIGKGGGTAVAPAPPPPPSGSSRPDGCGGWRWTPLCAL